MLASRTVARSNNEHDSTAACHDVQKVVAQVPHKVPSLAAPHLGIIQHRRRRIKHHEGRTAGFDLPRKTRHERCILVCGEPAGHVQMLQVAGPTSKVAKVGDHPSRIKARRAVHPMHHTPRGKGHADPRFDQRPPRPAVPSFSKNQVNPRPARAHVTCGAADHRHLRHGFTRPRSSIGASYLLLVDPCREVNPQASSTIDTKGVTWEPQGCSSTVTLTPFLLLSRSCTGASIPSNR